jgi:hypothetical protein
LEAGEKKEEIEGNPFYRLPMAEMHRGSRSLIGKEAAVFCSSWLVLPVAVLHVVVVMQ